MRYSFISTQLIAATTILSTIFALPVPYADAGAEPTAIRARDAAPEEDNPDLDIDLDALNNDIDAYLAADHDNDHPEEGTKAVQARGAGSEEYPEPGGFAPVLEGRGIPKISDPGHMSWLGVGETKPKKKKGGCCVM